MKLNYGKIGINKNYIMPNTKNQVFRIKIIDELLTRKKWVKTKYIQKVVQEKLMEDVSVRTIQKDIEALKNDTRLGYYAPILYDHKKKAYTYNDTNFSINNFSLTSEEINSLQFYADCLQVFSGYKLFDSYTSGIKKVIKGVSIKNKIRPQTNPKTIIQTDSLIFIKGQEYLERLVYAIDNKYKIRISYQSYKNGIPEERELYPLYLKEYRNRWYLLGYKYIEKKIKTYALDRIKSLKIKEEMCEENISFDPEFYFKYSFGITTPDVPVERVILEFNNIESYYV
jgi:predicted DNA-binding transcriptional regulator YafY